jgi:hypothetical protein
MLRLHEKHLLEFSVNLPCSVGCTALCVIAWPNQSATSV